MCVCDSKKRAVATIIWVLATVENGCGDNKKGG